MAASSGKLLVTTPSLPGGKPPCTYRPLRKSNLKRQHEPELARTIRRARKRIETTFSEITARLPHRLPAVTPAGFESKAMALFVAFAILVAHQEKTQTNDFLCRYPTGDSSLTRQKIGRRETSDSSRHLFHAVCVRACSRERNTRLPARIEGRIPDRRGENLMPRKKKTAAAEPEPLPQRP